MRDGLTRGRSGRRRLRRQPLGGLREMKGFERMSEPTLRKASDFDERDVGTLTWDASHNPELLTVSADRLSVTWGPRKPTYQGAYPPAWVPIRSEAHLHSGIF